MAPITKPIRFGIAIAILGVVMLNLPPRASALLGLLLVLGALAGSGANPAEPLKALTRAIYGGKSK